MASRPGSTLSTILLVLIALVACAAAPLTAPAPSPGPATEPDSTATQGSLPPTVVHHVGIVTGPARLRLTQDWLAQPAGNVLERERAYCVTAWRRIRVPWRAGALLGETVMDVVLDVARAAHERATPWSVRYQCPAEHGHAGPTLHTHPASLCNPDQGACQADSTQFHGGRCGPSAVDSAAVVTARQPFAVVQCAPFVYAFFGPASALASATPPPAP